MEFHAGYRYEAPLRRLTLSYASGQADREDIYQEILIAIWTALPRFRGDSSERTWVYRIAHNIAISASVRRNRRTRIQASYALDLDVRAASLAERKSSAGSRRKQPLTIASRRLASARKRIIRQLRRASICRRIRLNFSLMSGGVGCVFVNSSSTRLRSTMSFSTSPL